MSKKQIALLALAMVAIFGVGIWAGILIPRLTGIISQKRFYNTSALLQQVQTVSELVTVKYVIEKVVILEDVKWIAGLGESRVLLLAHGVVKAGIDLERLEPGDLQISGKNIVIRLPSPKITESYLDEKETKVIERSTGLLRTFDKNLEQTARQNAIDDIRRAARNNGILKEADTRARAQLAGLFKQLGFENVEFKSK